MPTETNRRNPLVLEQPFCAWFVIAFAAGYLAATGLFVMLLKNYQEPPPPTVYVIEAPLEEKEDYSLEELEDICALIAEGYVPSC
jgi:hypothetical protein